MSAASPARSTKLNQPEAFAIHGPIPPASTTGGRHPHADTSLRTSTEGNDR
jgi:hypothetical protein